MSGPVYLASTVSKAPTDETKGCYTGPPDPHDVFKIYFAFVFIIESIIPVVTLLVLNVISLIRLKIVANTLDRRSPVNGTGFTSAKIQATKLIILLTFICIVTRALDCTLGIVNRLRIGSLLSLADEEEAIVALLRAISFSLLFAAHALDGILYYCYDRSLRAASANVWNRGC